MVHGNYYGVQYEIYLNKELDLFNDILPICIDVRKMISLEKINKDSNQYKLVIIPYKELDKRFEKREHVRKYIESLNKLSYSEIEFNRKFNPELLKYYDVKIYKNFLKCFKFPEPYTQEELEKLEKCFNNLIDIYKSENYWYKPIEEKNQIDEKQFTLGKILKIQRIISNPEYFQEIKEIEQKLTNIELTEEEKKLVQKVLSHPKLEEAIEFNGINLIDGFY